MPWSPMYPETMIASPGLTLESVHHLFSTFLYSAAFARSESRYGERFPMADVDITIWSTAPASTTFVSPVAMGTPHPAAVLPMESITLSTMSMSRPSSIMTEQASARGVAPMTEMSLTVPATEIFPMSPPGKNRGFTVWPSIVNTTSSTTAESSMESSGTSAFMDGK